jgi:predicted dehydrogenase
MQRRSFAKVLGAGAALLPAAAAGTPAPEGIKVGVITHPGGAHLGAYFSALAAADVVDAVSLSDPGGQNVAEAREALGDKLSAVYDEPATLVREQRPAMALVSMEAAIAPPAIEVALRAGCHVMAEKPACVRIEDFERLHELAKTNDLYLMLALANRLNPEVREARRLIREGKMGKIYGLEAHLIADQTRLTRPAYHETWYAKKARGGGGHLIWLGIHWLDLATFLTGSDVVEVAGFTGVVGGQPLDVEDSAAIAMKFANGAFGTMTSGYYLDRGYHSHIKVWGSHGWLEIRRHGGLPLSWYSRQEQNPRIHRIDEFPGPSGSGYTPFVRACVRASSGLEEPPLTVDDSLRALKNVFACYQAAETGRVQRVG